MDTKKKAKLLTLAVSVVILAVAGWLAYSFPQRAAPPAPVASSTEPPAPSSTTAASQPAASADTSDIREGQTVIEDRLILLPGGSFQMGSPASERQRGEDERQHQVTLSPFYIDPYEVTQADYEAIMGSNPSHFSGGDLPVENVTWYDAVEYCNRLSESQGLTPAYTIDGNRVSWDRSANGYGVLTEAEWEYAARAGTTTIFHDGNQITSDNANFEGSYPYLIEENYVTRRDPSVVTSQNRGKTIPVGSLSPNGFGLYNRPLAKISDSDKMGR